MPIPQIPELLLILAIILIIFGAGKLPSIGNALGKGMSEFRKGQAGEDTSVETKMEEETTATKE